MFGVFFGLFLVGLRKKMYFCLRFLNLSDSFFMIVYYVIFVFLLFAVIIFFLRHLYRRSMIIRNRLQMDRVFANISHELLTPLTVIAASVEKLRNEEPRFAADYALMDLNVERMTRLLQEILETSKLQSGELRLLVSQGDVMEYIRNTALSLEPLMHKKRLAFSIHCSPQTMLGWIDTDKMDKIIYNLLSNAAKYTNDGGRVELQAQMNENYDHVTIRVIDTGIGIPKEQMKHLFRRFQDGAYRQQQVSGIGLGLALTRDLVVLHGGTIDCESEVGQGTTFTVTLPISKSAFSEAQIDNSHRFEIPTPRNTIADLNAIGLRDNEPATFATPALPDDAYRLLLVEDNEELLLLMRTLMSSKYHILTARNGEEALEQIANNPLDLIITDVMMPGMDGNELTHRIKSSQEWNHLPVIMLSAKTSEEDRKQSMLIGADDYISKPFKLGDLMLRINNLVENRRRILRERQQQADLAAGSGEATEEERPLTADEEFLNRAYQCVMTHLADSEFNRDAFAADMGASPSTLYNRLRALTGMNVSTYIRDIRMKEARRLAETYPDMRVSDLAYKVGFNDPKYFATCFKKEFGMQPSEFLKGS